MFINIKTIEIGQLLMTHFILSVLKCFHAVAEQPMEYRLMGEGRTTK